MVSRMRRWAHRQCHAQLCNAVALKLIVEPPVIPLYRYTNIRKAECSNQSLQGKLRSSLQRCLHSENQDFQGPDESTLVALSKFNSWLQIRRQR